MGNFSWFQMTHPITHGFCMCRPGWKKSGHDRTHSGDCSGVEEVLLRRSDAQSAPYMPPKQ